MYSGGSLAALYHVREAKKLEASFASIESWPQSLGGAGIGGGTIIRVASQEHVAGIHRDPMLFPSEFRSSGTRWLGGVLGEPPRDFVAALTEDRCLAHQQPAGPANLLVKAQLPDVDPGKFGPLGLEMEQARHGKQPEVF